jgi:type II secretory pathway pseudopilin PulG
MKNLNILISMNLGGQARRNQRGYAMAALLVAMAIMTIMMTVAMPVWKQTAQREKEEELIFRGLQYAHSIGLFQRKFANAFPPNIDALVEQRFLRKKYKDPITGEDFQPLLAGQGAPGAATPGAQPGQPQAPGVGGAGRQSLGAGSATLGAGRGASPGAGRGASPIATPGGTSPIGTPGAGPIGGVMGVVSKSKEKSIRLYNGRSHYNEWAFVFTPQQVPGAGAPGSAVPGQQPGQRGQPGLPGQRGGPGGPTFPGRGGPGIGPGRSGAPPNPFQPQPIFPPPRGRSGG